MKKSVLIMGASGFVGRHLEKYLADRCDVHAPAPTVDLCDTSSLCAAIHQAKPDWVIHLAAVSSVPDSFADPHRTFRVNFTGTLNLLLALREEAFHGRMLFVGSSQVYGGQNMLDPPLTEETLPRPLNPYAVSKLAAEALCYQWSKTAGFDIVVARPFNHIGPGQSEDFAVPNFARQIMHIKYGLHPPVLEVGDVDVIRDFTDVRDVVRAYVMLLEKGLSSESYNVCSGQPVSIRQLIGEMLTIAGLEVELVRHSDRFRPGEQSKMVGSAQKLYLATSWMPAHSLQDTLKSIMEQFQQAIA